MSRTTGGAWSRCEVWVEGQGQGARSRWTVKVKVRGQGGSARSRSRCEVKVKAQVPGDPGSSYTCRPTRATNLWGDALGARCYSHGAAWALTSSGRGQTGR